MRHGYYGKYVALQVRDVVLDDLVALMPMWEEIQAESLGLTVDALISRIELSLAQNGFRMVIAWDNDSAVGVACVALTDVGTWTEAAGIQVSGLHVLSSYRHRGVAKALLNAALQSADNWGCTSIVVSVPPQSREANRFFARLGFAPIATNRVTEVGLLRKKISVEPRRLVVARMRRRQEGATNPEIVLRHAIGK